MFFFCLVFAMSLCVSVYMCFEVTCWESADLLARLWCLTVSLLLSHWYPGSGVVPLSSTGSISSNTDLSDLSIVGVCDIFVYQVRHGVM